MYLAGNRLAGLWKKYLPHLFVLVDNVFENKVVQDAMTYLQWESNGFFHVKSGSNMLAGFTSMDGILGTVEYSARRLGSSHP